jgi:hypothetical protein
VIANPPRIETLTARKSGGRLLLIMLLCGCSANDTGESSRSGPAVAQATVRQDAIEAPRTPGSPTAGMNVALKTKGFFDLLVQAYMMPSERARGSRDWERFESNRVRTWPIEELVRWIDPNGLEVSDVNEANEEVLFALKDVRAQLDGKSGRLHETLAHIAHQATDPQSRYSRITESSNQGVLVAEVGEKPWYRLSFVKVDGRLLLQKCEYIHFEGH